MVVSTLMMAVEERLKVVHANLELPKELCVEEVGRLKGHAYAELAACERKLVILDGGGAMV